MRRYFYDSSSIIAKWLQKNAFSKSYEDDIYRAAFLSALKNDPVADWKALKESILNMTMQQQQKYANNTHIEYLFSLFHHLHKYSRGRSMIVDSSTSKGTTQLVDPDKFPIWDLKKYSPIYRSLWNNYLADLRYDLGFQPIIRQSQVEHHAAGRGVYIILPLNHQKIAVGSLLGLVPGKIFRSFADFKSISLQKRKQYYRSPQHIHFPSGKILQLGDLALKTKNPFGLQTEHSSRVDATYHNPYAIGHMINHPPSGYEPNVCFSQMNIKLDYFPKYLLRYLPYEDYTTDLKNITLFGIFAIKEIQHQQQLFVNYNESHIYPIDNIPQWMIDPPQLSPIFQYLRKGQYQLTESSYWRYIERRALEKNKQLLEKYEKQKVLRPDAVQFEDQARRYRKLKIRLEDHNEFQHM